MNNLTVYSLNKIEVGRTDIKESKTDVAMNIEHRFAFQKYKRSLSQYISVLSLTAPPPLILNKAITSKILKPAQDSKKKSNYN